MSDSTTLKYSIISFLRVCHQLIPTTCPQSLHKDYYYCACVCAAPRKIPVNYNWLLPHATRFELCFNTPQTWEQKISVLYQRIMTLVLHLSYLRYFESVLGIDATFDASKTRWQIVLWSLQDGSKFTTALCSFMPLSLPKNKEKYKHCTFTWWNYVYTH